jgi:hypothetical protein
MGLFRRIALGLVATASALVASFATIQSPSNNLASTNIDNSTSQQSIVEEKETTTISNNSTPQTQKLDQETKTQPLKISANPDKSIKIQIDKNLIKKPNSTKAVKSSNKFKTILPSIGFGAAAQAFNLCPETIRKETQIGGYHVIAHANKCGQYYTYMSPDAGNFLKYKINAAKIHMQYAALGSLVGRLFPGGGVYLGTMSWRSDLMVNDIEYCSSQGKGMWLNSNSYTAFLNAKVSCD